MIAMAVALALFLGTSLLTHAQCPPASFTVLDQNPHNGNVVPLGFAPKCYAYPPELTGAQHPIGDWVVDVNAPFTAPEVAFHIYNVRQGQTIVFAGLSTVCDTVYDTLWVTNTVPNGNVDFNVKVASGHYLAILSFSLSDTIDIQINAVDPIVTYPAPFECGDVMAVPDQHHAALKPDEWRRLDWLDAAVYKVPIKEAGIYYNGSGKKIIIQ